jgi:hypothetical protein
MVNSPFARRTRIGVTRPNLFGRRRSARPRLELLEERSLLSTWTVTDNSDSPTDTGSLRYAIQNAPSGTTIDFASTVASPIVLTAGALKITTDLDIEGPADALTIRGNKAGAVFDVAKGVTANLSALVITDGSSANGGGIENAGTLTLSDCTVSGNSATSFGGVGGGIDNLYSLTASDCTLSGNSATGGGGIANVGKLLSLTDCTLLKNSTSVYGAGLWNGGFGTATLTNCTLADNSAGRRGGGITNDGKLTLTNCTVSANSVLNGTGRGFGGGISNDGTAIVANTIIAGNVLSGPFGVGRDAHGIFDSLGHNLIGDPTGSAGWVSTDLLNVNPRLAPLANYGGPTPTVALEPGSPADNAGSASIRGVNVPTTDQRGALRKGGLDAGRPDIGAYQASSSYLVTSAADSNDAGTLRAAVSWANVNANINKPKPTSVAIPVPNTIVFDTKGAFSKPQTITLSPSLGQLLLTNTKTPEAIVGPGASILTVSGGDKVRVFSELKGVTAMIEALTIADGSAYVGGGIANSGTLSVTSCALSNNSANAGGGIWSASSAAVVLSNCTISKNTVTGNGGGISNSGMLTVTNCTVSGNSGGGTAGGILSLGKASLTNCTISSNSVPGNGGGITNEGTLALTNCTLSKNSSKYIGGGIDNSGTLTLTNSTVSGNSAQTDDGGISNDGSATLANTIIAGNRLTGSGSGGTDASGKFNSLGHNLIGNNAGSTGWVTSDLLNVNPKLGPLANNGGPTQTMALLPGSPTIGAGNIAFITNPPFSGPPFTDQRGLPRIVSGKVDIGAFQTQGGVSPAVAKPVAVKGHPVRTAKVVRNFTSPKIPTLVLSSRRLLPR